MSNLTINPKKINLAGKSGSSGMSCKFFNLDGIGLKLYKNEWERDDSYYRQGALADDNLAPCVGSTFELEFNGCTWYGHTTEIVETIVDCSGHGGNAGPNGEGLWGQFYARDDYQELGCKIADCMDKLHEAGYRWGDDHVGNFGILNGEVVIIDCAGVVERDENDDSSFFNEWDKFRMGYEYGDDPADYMPEFSE